MKLLIFFYIFFFFLCLSLLLCTSCKTQTVYVPVQKDSIIYKNRTDSLLIYKHDSIIFHQKGDTVFIEKYRTMFADRNRTDTIYQKIEVEKPYPVTETKKVIPKWCWWIIGLVLLQVGYWIIRLKRK